MSDAAVSGRRCVLVTGAAGFVGAEVVRTLVAAGHRVRAAVRTTAPERRVVAGAEYVAVGDIAGEPPWAAALAGVDAVVHAAARVHATGAAAHDTAAFHATNVMATRQLAHASAAAGVTRFVFLSSIKVNGEWTGERPFAAADPPSPADAYARSKLEAESELARLAAEGPFDVVTVRPPLVYGPGVGANFARLMRLVERGVPLPFGAVRNQRSLVSVWNLASFVATTLATPAAGGRTWLVSDGEDLSTPDLVRRMASAFGRRPRLLSVPPSVLRGAGTLIGRREEFRRLTESLRVDAGPARASLGWAPVIDVDAALVRTVRER
jgi:nucleoside-diphosphate-sugar epimerase